MSRPITDYGKFHISSDDYHEEIPQNSAAAIDIIRTAIEQGSKIRVRGSGHSLSGMTLPRAGEVLIRTSGLTHFHFETARTITVGAGAVMWDIRDFVSSQGWSLPVYNGGWAGPTLGGYINAGGMGLRVPPQDRERVDPDDGSAPNLISVSERHGGLWEHIKRIRFVDGTGALNDVKASDPLFPWLFASCGQLGLILEAELKLLPASDDPPALPIGSTGRLPVLNPLETEETDGLPPETGMPWIYWFSYLVPPADEPAAWSFLGQWVDAHSGIIEPTGGWVGPQHAGAAIGFRYLVKHKTFTPPLLYPRHEDFVLMGVMARCDGIGQNIRDEALQDAERAFVTEGMNRGWRLYAQAENLSRNLDYRAYFGKDLYEKFRALKARFDPKGLLNAGEIFDDSTPAPLRASTARKLSKVLTRLLAS